jgi:hypothetical protein
MVAQGAETPDFGALLAAGTPAFAGFGEMTRQGRTNVPAPIDAPAGQTSFPPAAALAAILPVGGNSLPVAAPLPAGSAPEAPVVSAPYQGVPAAAVSAEPIPASESRRLGANPRAVLAAVARRGDNSPADVGVPAEDLPPPAKPAPLPLALSVRKRAPQPDGGDRGIDEDAPQHVPAPLQTRSEDAASVATPGIVPFVAAATQPAERTAPKLAADPVSGAVASTRDETPLPASRQSERKAAAPVETGSGNGAEQRFSAAALAALAPSEQATKISAAAADSPSPVPGLPGPTGPASPAAPLPIAAPGALVEQPGAPGPDLARLVETIARARAEVQQVAVGAGSVHVALRHAEFGAVSVRFEHDRGDLAVSLSSPDPDFARAVSAVAAPQAPTPATDATAARDGNARPSDGQGAAAQAAGQGPSHQRGQGETQHRQPLASPPPPRRSGLATADSTPDGDGIFA